MTRIAVLSDIHFPEHHRQAWPLTLTILPDLNLDKVILLGDIVEFESLSKYDVPPDRRMNLKPDLAAAEKELLRLRKALPNLPIEFHRGNHEFRLDKYLYNRAPELYGLDEITTPALLHLHKYDIEWWKPGRTKREGKLLMVHGDKPKVGGQYPARNLYMRISGNFIAGHFHRFDRYFHRLADGAVHGGWVNGCLRTLNPEWEPHSQWTLGFSVVETSSGGFFHVEQIVLLKRGANLWASIGGEAYSSEKHHA